MANFVPNELHLREVLLYLFNILKKAAEAHQLLFEAYPEYASSVASYERWFVRFRNGDFDVRDKERPGQPKKFEDSELETLLSEDSYQTQQNLADSLGVDRSTIAKRLKALGMIQKQGHWVPYELKPRDVERRFYTCEQLLQRQKRKGFLHRIVTGDEKWIHYDNPKRKKSYGYSGHASTSTTKPDIHGKKLMLCIWWVQKGVVYYELLSVTDNNCCN